MRSLLWAIGLWLVGAGLGLAPAWAAEYVWIEAEHGDGLRGHWSPRNPAPKTPAAINRWAIAGPGVAAEWSQGGESEWSSIAAPAQARGAVVRYAAEIPLAGRLAVWVRYADYQKRAEVFRLRLLQAGRVVHDTELGQKPILPEDDDIKLMWGWAFGWARSDATLAAGPVVVELVAETPTEAPRHVDAILLTDDLSYRPALREKPPFAYFAPLERARGRAADTPAGTGSRAIVSHPAPAPLARPAARFAVPADWRTPPLGGPGEKPFRLLWNIPLDFWQQQAIPPARRIRYPFYIQEGSGAQPRAHGRVYKAFLERYGGERDVPIFKSPLITPVLQLNQAAAYLGDGAPFLDWLRRTKSPFAMLLNYQWQSPPFGLGKRGPEVARNLALLRSQFLGYVSGESIAYVYSSDAELGPRLRAARSRRDVLEALRVTQTEGLKKKLATGYGVPAPPRPWADVISALDVDTLSLVHALAAWGERTVATEATANEPCYAMRYAFMRGAARQYGARWIFYLSSNFGDTATTFTSGGYQAGPETNFYHSHYDPFSGAGLTWYRKAYLSAYMAGAAGIYLEQGNDQFFIPSPGDNPIQLSPFGRITEEFIRLVERHPDRGVPYTPIALLLDPGHGFHHYETDSGAFSQPASANPPVLGYGAADASIRDWINLACYPLPVVEGEPLTSPRLSFVQGMHGDLFDVLVADAAFAPGRAQRLAQSYRVIILAGEVELSEAWGRGLRAFVEAGGTLLVADGLARGPGAALLGLAPSPPPADPAGWRTARRIVWQHAGARQELAANAYRYRARPAAGTPLATADDGTPVATLIRRGQGRLIYVSIAHGLGIDRRATPLLAQLLVHLRAGLSPVEVEGPVGYGLNRTRRGWAVTLMNNRGVRKPQHGLAIPEREHAARVRLTTRLPARGAREWLYGEPLRLEAKPGAAGLREVELWVPAGTARIVELIID